MFRSIRWTLQMWHAAILAAVLVAFGSVMFYYLPLIEYRRIDDDLAHVAYRVGSSVRPVFRPNAPRPVPRSPVTKDIQNLAEALNSNNVAGAQQALTKLQKDLPPGGRRGLRRFRSLDTAKSGGTDSKTPRAPVVALRPGAATDTAVASSSPPSSPIAPPAVTASPANPVGGIPLAGNPTPRRRPGSAAGIPRTPTGDAH